MMPPRRIGRLERPDCAIHYEVTGSGPAIIFAHGLGGNHMSWWQQVAHFARSYTCVTFAHRGFAPSSPLPGGPDPAAYADDLAALVAHLGLTDFSLVAQSMGGWTTLEFALRRPAGLRALVLGATLGTLDPSLIQGPARLALEAWSAASAKVVAELAASSVHVAAGARMAEEQPAMHLLYRHIDEQNAGLDKEALRRRLWQMRTRSPEELAGVACPVLIIANDEDPLIPPPAADAIAAMVPGVRAAHIERAGHSAYFERPAIYNQMVEAFILHKT